MYCSLPREIVSVIQDEVAKIKQEYDIVNPIIRNDIFSILENLCVVLWYPLENDEEANGLHVERYVKGEPRHFIFINTGNALEKQVYTAAHELGHVWNIDKKVLEKINIDVDSEVIINRFAAELLMPEDIFVRFLTKRIEQMKLNPSAVDEEDILKLIVYLMDVFMVPFKAVIYRLYEIECLTESAIKRLENIAENQRDRIDEYIKIGNYANLNLRNPKRTMGSLYEMLNQAEERGIFSPAKIKSIREQFGIDAVVQTEDGEEMSLLLPREGADG